MEKDEEKFFYEDEVAMLSPKSNQVKYGLVLTTNRSRSETDLKKSPYKSPDEIKVIWHPQGTEEIISDDKVVLMDRSLMPGDVVRKINNDKSSQFGYCENIEISVAVKILNTNKVIENINSRNLSHTKLFTNDSSVFYESWVGGIFDVKSKVTFASQDGSIFTIDDPYRQDFISLSTSDNFSVNDNVFYPGQKLKMCLDSLENAKFLKISNLMNCLWHNYKKKYSYKFGSKWVKVYVQDIAVTSVEVEWYCQTSSKTKSREDNWPERIITGDNLKKLKTIDLFESCSIQVGDTHWYEIKDTDKLITMKQWRSKCTETFHIKSGSLPNKIKKDKHCNQLVSIKNSLKDPLNCVELENPYTPQNTSFQDDFLSKVQNNDAGINITSKKNYSKYAIVINKSDRKFSTSLSSYNSIHKLKSNRLKRNRMWKSLVKKSKQFNVPKVSTKPNTKIIVEICFTKSMVDVIWQDGTRELGVSSTDLNPVPTLDDLEFFPGDFVTEKNPSLDVYGVIKSVDHAERTAYVQWFKVFPSNPSLPKPIDKTDFSVYDLRDHPDFHFKSGCLVIHISPDTNLGLTTFTAGQVLNAGPDGKISVKWVNGEKSECWPQELFVVKLNDDDGFSYQDEEFDEDDDAVDDDDKSGDWMSVTSPETSHKGHESDNEEVPKHLTQSMKQANSGIKSFFEAFEQIGDFDKVNTIKKSLEQIKTGFDVGSYLSNSETKDLEVAFKDFLGDITKKIEILLLQLDKDERVADLDISCDTKYEDKVSVNKLKKMVTDFIENIHQNFKKVCLNSNTGNEVLSKHSKIEDQNENNDLLRKITEWNNDLIEVVEPSTLPSINSVDPIEFPVVSSKSNLEVECEVIVKPEEAGVFDVVETLLDNSHQFINDKEGIHPTMLKIINKDIQILQKSLPAGIWVKTFENRMDLFSVMIRGPEKTPYAGGLFIFDVKVPHTYPLHPPLCHYYSYCDDRLNPNLYEDGKVCLSLLGTWSGQGVELWSPKDSNLLQLIVSIQGLILVNEPYYNEAGFDSQRGQQLAKENSRVYNEMVLIKVVQSMTNMLKMLQTSTLIYFKEEILEHLKLHGPKLINTIENWIKMSNRELTEDEKAAPGYPLLPLSKGFCLSIRKALNSYKETLISMNIVSK